MYFEVMLLDGYKLGIMLISFYKNVILQSRNLLFPLMLGFDWH